MNAILDALSSEGIDHFDLPASPHRVWEALQKSKEKKNEAF
jgi:carbon-monoxide dehydrogenase large subunit